MFTERKKKQATGKKCVEQTSAHTYIIASMIIKKNCQFYVQPTTNKK